MSARTVAGWESLTENDREEWRKLERFTTLVIAGKSQAEAYAEIYGEVVFHDREAEAATKKVRRP